MLGPAAYMAPEQIQDGQVDGRADQYALACTAFELLCGGGAAHTTFGALRQPGRRRRPDPACPRRMSRSARFTRQAE
jgi:serine/threonine-protein kinase